MNFNPFIGWPFSGPVTQSISPWTSLFSPRIEVNFQGNADIEADVLMNVASYGRQLGQLTDAVLAIAESNDDPRVQKLRALAEKVNQTKARHKVDAEDAARAQLEKLREIDPQGFERVIRSYQTQSTG